MTRIPSAAVLAMVVAVVLLLGVRPSIAQTPTELVNSATPGATGTETVPALICFVRIQAAGGSGGDGQDALSGDQGGLGARLGARVAVHPGAQLAYSVGGAGGDGAAGAGGAGGAGGGGQAAHYGSDIAGGGGGGASALTVSGVLVVVAGGGGGGSDVASGGVAGAANGAGANGEMKLDDVAAGGWDDDR